MYKQEFFFDFETRSRSDLRKTGAVRYATDESTEVTLLTWCFGRTGSIKVWRLGWPVPSELYEVAMHPEKYNMIAHNVLFDYMIWTQVWGKKNIPDLIHPKIENLTDNMALTCHFRVGGSLDNAAQTLGLPITKDKDGRRIMLKQCKPDRHGNFPELTSEEWGKFEYYGIIDTKLLREIYYMCPRLSEAERFIWEWTFRRNLRGIRLDMPLLEEMNDILQTERPKLVKEFDHLVGGKCKINSPFAKGWFQQYYPWIQNMQADTIREMLADSRPEIPDFARRALECKAMAGSTSLAKIETAIARNYQGRIYEVLAYHYAHTKRWAGRGIQVQNFPRPVKGKDQIDFDLNVNDLANIVRAKRPGLQDPLGFIKNLLRRIFIPDQGTKFYCGDWSKIEPTVLFWLTGMGRISKLWYEDMASTIYSVDISTIGKDSEERQLGKSAALGCGYGMGHVKFRDDVLSKTGLLISEDLAKRAVYAYRNKYHQVTQFWRELELGMKMALNGTVTKLCEGKVYIMPMAHKFRGKLGVKNLQIRLPSGGLLFYHDVRLDSDGLTFDSGDRFRKKLYGGLLCEHVVSSTAREILVPAVWRLEKAGFDVLNVVHDEIWASAEESRDEEFERIMCINPSWCPDMAIGAEGDNGRRYLK